MNSKLRNRRLVIAAALFIAGIASVDTTYAQTAFSREITLPDVVTTTLPTTSIEPGLLDLGGLKSVNANVMALVSFQTKQVDLARTPIGAQEVAKDLIAMEYPANWNTSTQFSCLTQLWNKESHWNFKAHNYRSGAHGIAQALPAIKMESVGTDWRTNPVTQIKWGLTYIEKRYDTPCAALRFHNRRHHY